MRKYIVAVLVLGLLSAGVWFLLADRMTPVPQAQPTGTEIQPGAVSNSTPENTPADSSRTSVVSPTGAIRIKVLWQHDSQPASGIAILLAPDSGLGEGDWRQAGVTDTQGQLLIGSLDPGQLAVRPEFFETAKSCNVVAGATCELDFELPSRTDVHGLVVDRHGHPVSGAEIWVSHQGRSTVGDVVAHSDAAGGFSTAFYGDSRGIAARAEAVGASDLVPVRAHAGSQVDVRLVLVTDVARLEGDVVDEQGHGVRDAWVRIGFEQDFGRLIASAGKHGDISSLQFPAPAAEARTDRDGRFLAACCTTGRQQVTVWALGFGPWRQVASIDKAVSNRIHVVLDPEASVSGIVRDANGQPVPKLMVSALPSAFGSEPGQPGPWQSWTSRSDAEGGYELRGLPAGEVRVGVADQEFGSASSKARLVAGQHAIVDLVVDRGTSLRLAVRDRHDVPQVGWSIRIHAQGSDPRGRPRLDARNAETDASGRVTFAQCLTAPYDVELSPGGAVLTWSVLRQEGLQPGPDAHVLVVDAPERPRAFIRGAVRDGSGHDVACVVDLTHHEDTGKYNKRLDLPAQPLAIGPLFDGSYDLTVTVEGCVPLRRDAIAIEAGRDVDLGALTFEPTGQLTVQLVDEQDQPCGAERVWLVSEDGNVEQVLDCSPQKPASFKNIVPGNYDVTACSDRLGWSTAHVAVAGNNDNSIQLRLAGGIPCEFRIDGHGAAVGSTEISWRDAAGALLGTERNRSTDNDLVIRRALPPGRYRIEVRASARPRLASAEFVVVDPMPGPVAVHLEDVSREEWLRSYRK